MCKLKFNYFRDAKVLHNYMFFTGIHPHEAKSWDDNYYNELKDIAKNPECVAIGICGLDYNKDFSSPDVQKKVFELQVIIYLHIM